MEQYQVRSMVDGLGGVYEGEGSLQGTYDTLNAALEAADGQPSQYVMRVSDGFQSTPPRGGRRPGPFPSRSPEGEGQALHPRPGPPRE